jgi:hypothetical protein
MLVITQFLQAFSLYVAQFTPLNVFFSSEWRGSFFSRHSKFFIRLSGVDSFLSRHSLAFFCLSGVDSFFSRHSLSFFCLSGEDLSFHATQCLFFV